MLTIDASVWVAADAADEEARPAAHALLAAVLNAGLALHQPTLTIVEVTAAVARRTQDLDLAAEAGRRVLEAPGVILHALDLEAAAESSALAGRLSLRAADAVYAATALRHATQLVTLDTELHDRTAPAVQCFSPAEWLSRHRQS